MITIEAQRQTPVDVKDNGYPCLKIDSRLDLIVLFVEPCKGICIDPGKTDNRGGEYSKRWFENRFTPLRTIFNVTISSL